MMHVMIIPAFVVAVVFCCFRFVGWYVGLLLGGWWLLLRPRRRRRQQQQQLNCVEMPSSAIPFCIAALEGRSANGDLKGFLSAGALNFHKTCNGGVG